MLFSRTMPAVDSMNRTPFHRRRATIPEVPGAPAGDWPSTPRRGKKGCSIPGGPIVLVSGKECQLLELDAKGVHRVTRCTLPCDPPMAILPAGEPGQFALISANGRVSVFSTRE